MRIGHLALRVVDPPASADHAITILGLRQTAEAEGQILLSTNEKHHELQLIPGDSPGLDHLGIEVDGIEALERAREGAVAAGATILSESPQEEGFVQAFRALAPGNLVLEVYADMQRERLTIAHGLRGPLRKLGHITIFSPSHQAIVDFLVRGLGFRVSDTLADRMTWLRCDSDHHGIAVGAGEAPRLHHYALELTGWGAMRDFLDHLALAGRSVIYGPLRHGIGFNIAAYFPDVDGCLVEVYTEMLQIDNDATYVPIDWSAAISRARNLWGPESGPEFLEHGIPILEPGGTASS
jgi:catechol 2,3-dioxygenase